MDGGSGILIGAQAGGAQPQRLDLARANRHGLIAGATGTGKTVTVQVVIEGLSRAGVPCFIADVKGDLAGLALPGSPTSRNHPAFADRASQLGDDAWRYAGVPVQLWDLFGQQGHPVRTTVSEMGPLLLARLLGLNPVQEGVLTVVFHVADAEGLLLIDLDDLQAMLADCAERASALSANFGNISRASVGTIQRALLQLRAQGAEHFFGEPALDLADMMTLDDDGRGVVNILAADRLMQSPKLYATFLLWMLSELFEQLPEVGDVDRPRLCFFFDEAHLLFDDAPDALLDKIEQVVRLIRSKGVGIYFITQNPTDIPERVAGQLNNRIQHKLNAFTPRDRQSVRAAADSFRINEGLDVATAITELKVGEALVSLLQPDGAPAPVERVLIRPPSSRVGPLTAEERKVLLQTDAIGDRYDVAVNRESAEELLEARTRQAMAAAAGKSEERTKLSAGGGDGPWGKMAESALRSASSSLGRQIGNEIGRQVLGKPRRRSSTGGGLLASVMRGVLGGLLRR